MRRRISTRLAAPASTGDPNQTVKAAAERAVRVIRSHRRDIARLRRIAEELAWRIEAALNAASDEDAAPVGGRDGLDAALVRLAQVTARRSGSRLARALRLARDLECVRLREDFSYFLRRTFTTVDPSTTYRPNWHIDLLAEHLKACADGHLTRLIINVPPRSLKSITVSVDWPAWLLGRDPTRRVIAASYSFSLALKHSLDCRLVLGVAWYARAFPGVRLTRDQNEKAKFGPRGAAFASPPRSAAR